MTDETLAPARPRGDAAENHDHLGYWRALIPQLVRDLSLPVDRVRTPQTPTARDPIGVQLPESLRGPLAACAAAAGTETFDVLAASWLVLMVRLSGQPELTVGLPAGRDGESGAAAHASNVVPVPVDIDPGQPFIDIVRTVAAARTAVTTGGEPFSELRAALAGAEDDLSEPLFRVAITSAATDSECAGAELVLVIGDEVAIEHTAVFDRQTTDDIGRQWLRSLPELVAAPEAPADLPDLVDPTVRARIREWGTGWFAPVPAWTVPAQFAEQAAAVPDRVAVRCADEALTYAQLADRAFRLARLLRDLGAQPGRRVAVCLQRSTDMLAALVGVMASGAAYVPVDPAYPAERVEYMLTDADVVAVVTSSDLVAQLPQTDAAVVALDTSGEELSAVEPIDPREPADPGATLDDTAYVIYTSGSTGKPKGVMVPHRGLTNFLESVAREPGLTTGESLLAVTTLSFDIAGLELYLPLVVGGTVVIATHDECRDPAALAERLVEHGVTQMQATPATWRLLLDWGWQGKSDLVVLCGGEALPPTLAEALVPKCAALWNMYGPTETTIWSTLCQIRVGEAPTLGHPFRNTTMHVVDGKDREVGIGVAGELLLGGDGLAQGYLGRPDLTAEKFIASPFSDFPQAGERVYRTGDLVRWRRDGRLEFLGRIDNQVKVRGFRIELGEIEVVLGKHPAVAEAVVVVREDSQNGKQGDKQLVGYVVAKPAAGASGEGERGTVVTAAELRRHVAASLPGYMVPAAVVVCESFPRTPNGKTDRRALPAPDSAATARDDVVPPRDELEARLVEAWQEVLGIAPIGVTDNFFDLGVDSLTAARLFARIERDFGTKLPLAPVFRAPTVAALAELLRDAGSARSERWSSLIPIQANGSALPIFGVHGGAGTILLYHELSRALGNDQPFYGLQIAGLYGGEAPDQTVEEMAERYLAEMKQVQAQGPYTILGYCFGALVAQEMALRLTDRNEEVALVGALNGPSISYIETYNPLFDDEGALTDAEGKVTERTASDEPKAARWRAAVKGGPRELLHAFTPSSVRRLRRTARRRWRVSRFKRVLAARSPLPDWMREGLYIQRLTKIAQDRYKPVEGAFPVAVFRPPGLYHADDLGWRSQTTGPVHVCEVPGEGQNTPRQTMQFPYVESIARQLQETLRSERNLA
ncbi:MAG: non-ribosomal peptide synthetase [Acidothermaceae bacterium]